MTAPPSPLRSARRLEWVVGSTLGWRDLRASVEAEQAMLAMHMRALHDTWGVALGLAVVLATDERSVLVTPGFAITCLGTPILLPTAQIIAGPAVSGAGVSAWDLVLDAPSSGNGDPCYRATTCDLKVPPRSATVRWHLAETSLDQRTSVVLARFRRLPTGRLSGSNLERRRGVRVMERPHVASGIVSAGDVTWTASDDRLLASLDTSAAGFSRPAVYRVWVAHHDPWPPDVVGSLLSVVSAGTTAVHLQLLVPGVASSATAQAIANGLSLGWLGVEPVRGCPPAFTAAQVSPIANVEFNVAAWSAALAAIPGFQQ